jgi:hypothetical protein
MILTVLSALGYPIVIQFKRGGWRKFVCAAPAAGVFLLDIIANYTELTWVWGLPLKNEYSISRRVKRMTKGEHGETLAQVQTAKAIQVFLDACEPDGKH